MAQPQPTKVQEWTERFERFQHTNATTSQFCRDEGVSLPSFYQWRTRLLAKPISKTVPPRRSSTKAMTDRPVGIDAVASPVRITVESAGTVIHCHCDSLQAVETVLAWADRQRHSGFKQFIVQS